MQSVIATHALQRSFGAHHAVRGIDLAVPSGGIYGFLGPNGAGKTTTIRLLLGLLKPSGGTISILGRAMPRERLDIAGSVGSLVETPSLYDHLTGRENLDITRRVLRLAPSEIERVLEVVDLGHAARQRVAGYSLGMRQRLALARAMLGKPRLLILDEPSNGLDPDGMRTMRELIRALPERAGASVFLSSHLLAEVEQVATHVGLMFEGRLLAQGAIADVLAAGGPRIEIAVDRAAAARETLEAAGLAVEARDGMLLAGRGPGGSEIDPASVNRLLVTSGFAVAALAQRRPSLETMYLSLTRAAARNPQPAPEA